MREQDIRTLAIEQAAAEINAVKADLPGLWSAPGFPELTTNQLLNIYMERRCSPLGSAEVYSRE